MVSVTVESELAAVVGAENVAAGSDSDAVDGVAPRLIVRPGTYDEAAGVLRLANEQRLAVIALGGRVHEGFGNVPARYDLALDIRRLDQIVEFEPADLTITCQAGITLGALRRTAAADGLAVPLDPAIPDAATVGGVLAANVSGPARMSFGTPRDFTIGMRVVTAEGRETRAGGKVVKNVAGYDLCKLYIGSLGTLGVTVEATFKTVPLTMAEAALAFDFGAPRDACRLASDAFVRGLAVRSATVSRQAGAWRLQVTLAGTPAAVERSRREIESLAAGAGESSADARAAAELAGETIVRLGVLPSKLPALLGELPADTVEAYPTVGLCRATAAIEVARGLAAKFGGTCVVERCPAEVKREIDVFGERPSSFALMRSLKQQFDPNGVLSPGRYVGKL